MLVKTEETNSEVMQSRTIRALMVGAVAIIIALIAFNESLFELVHRWTTQDEYSHGFLIPVIAAWLLWARRDALVASIGQPSWAGCWAYFARGANAHRRQIKLAIYSVAGRVCCRASWHRLGIRRIVASEIVFIPIVFLLFAIPMPYFIDAVLSYRLQLVSSQLGVWFIRLAQIPVYLEGNVIDLGVYKLQVVEACSGLRYLYPLDELGFPGGVSVSSAALAARARIFIHHPDHHRDE